MATKKDTRVLFVIVDGIGDNVYPQSGYKTIFEQVEKPTLDQMAKTGANGLMDPFECGFACGSDTAHLSIFGYTPLHYYRGRGAFETEGAGLPMKAGDIAFKCNFSTVSKDEIVTLRRVDRHFEKWGLDLVSYLNNMKIPGFEQYTVSTKHATEHRIGLKVSGPGLSNQITDTDPMEDGHALMKIKAKGPEGELTAKICQALSDEIRRLLEIHPINVERVKQGLPAANCVLLRGCGIKLEAQPIGERFNTKPVTICPTCVIAGITMSIGFERLIVPGTTGDKYSDLNAKAKAAYESLYKGEHRFCFLHVKAYDEAGHDGHLDVRRDMVKRIDTMMKLFFDLAKDEQEDCVVAITGDHSTPTYRLDHTYEPVPFNLTSVHAVNKDQKLFLSDEVKVFSEIAAAYGVLGRFPGREIMPLVFRARDRLNEKGFA